MNPQLKEQVQTVRGSIVIQLEKKFVDQPSWLEVFPCEGSPAFIFRDTRNGKEVNISICDMHGALNVLKAFFGEE